MVMNRQVNLPQLQRIMMEFGLCGALPFLFTLKEKQSELSDMKQEMMSDTMDMVD